MSKKAKNQSSTTKEIVVPIPKTFFMVDAMYYHAARQSYDQAIKLTQAVKKAERTRESVSSWGRASPVNARDSDAAVCKMGRFDLIKRI